MESKLLDFALFAGLIVSMAATVVIWARIFRSADPSAMKTMLAATVAIPFFGPLLWLFLDMPARRSDATPSFNGPVAPLPTKPKWVAVSARALIVLSGVVVIAFLTYLFLSTIRGIAN